MTRDIDGSGRQIAFYVRISTDEDHQKYSLAAQEERLRAHCQRTHGDDCTIAEVYRDEESGTHTERAGLAKMLRDAQAGAFDTLLVFRVDRLSRKLRDLTAIIDKLTEWGVVFRSVTEPFDTSHAAGKMMLQMLGIFAEFERESLLQRSRICRRRMIGAGKLPTPVASYGYRRGGNGAFAVEPSEVGLVKKIFDLYTSDLMTTSEIASALNTEGIKKRCGSLWESATILGILKNPVYVGKVRWGGVVLDAPHEHLLSEEQFAAAQEMCKRRSAGGVTRLRGRDSLFLRFVYCGECGGHMTSQKHENQRYYICCTRNNGGECRQPVVPTHAFDDAVLSELRTVLRGKRLMRRIWRDARALLEREKKDLAGRLRELQQEASDLSSALGKYYAAAKTEALDLELFSDRISCLKEQHVDVSQRAEALRGELGRPELAPFDPAALAECGSALDQLLAGTTYQRRTSAIATCLERVIVRRRRSIDVWYRLPSVDILRDLLQEDIPLYKVRLRAQKEGPRIRFLVPRVRPGGPEAGRRTAEIRTDPTPLSDVGTAAAVDVALPKKSALAEFLAWWHENAVNGRRRKPKPVASLVSGLLAKRQGAAERARRPDCHGDPEERKA